eukprot:TRINITY_DN47711_c0_g1_i1.p1 TRINITY_DN47711_c0_g1~~TRINITY_DN47711_c0_g1_i1.p1  ORF type:complete len:116 (+),score=20.01 TRINITY_DN47711_c0_g1_i1:80-427(+)
MCIRDSLMGDKRPKITPNEAMPGRVVLPVELLLDEGGDLLLGAVLFHGLLGDGDGVLLHVVLHLGNLDAVSYTHLRAHETPEHLVCRLLLEKKKKLPCHSSSSPTLTLIYYISCS